MRRWTGAMLVLLSVACDGDSTDATPVPDGLRIPVVVDGEPNAPVDAELLRKKAPDYRRGETRAWRLSSLLGPAYDRPHVILEVHGGGGVSRTFPSPTQRNDGSVLALMVNRRGDAVILPVPAEGPLPRPHAHAGRKRPAPDRVHHVRRLELHHPEGPTGHPGPARGATTP